MRFARALLALAAATLWAEGAAAQRRAQPYTLHYDTATVTTVAGEVLSVQSPAPGGRGSAGVEALMRSGADSLVVHLGPIWHLERNGISLAKGDRIEVTGSKVTIAGRPALVAAELRKGDRTLTLRDARGTPQWTRSNR